MHFANDRHEHVLPDAVRPVELCAVRLCTGSIAAGVYRRLDARCKQIVIECRSIDERSDVECRDDSVSVVWRNTLNFGRSN